MICLALYVFSQQGPQAQISKGIKLMRKNGLIEGSVGRWEGLHTAHSALCFPQFPRSPSHSSFLMLRFSTGAPACKSANTLSILSHFHHDLGWTHKGTLPTKRNCRQSKVTGERRVRFLSGIATVTLLPLKQTNPSLLM